MLLQNSPRTGSMPFNFDKSTINILGTSELVKNTHSKLANDVPSLFAKSSDPTPPRDGRTRRGEERRGEEEEKEGRRERGGRKWKRKLKPAIQPPTSPIRILTTSPVTSNRRLQQASFNFEEVLKQTSAQLEQASAPVQRRDTKQGTYKWDTFRTAGPRRASTVTAIEKTSRLRQVEAVDTSTAAVEQTRADVSDGMKLGEEDYAEITMKLQ